MILNADTIQGFVGSLLVHKFDGATKIPTVHKEWWKLCTEGGNYVAIAAPRSHAKSTSITFSYLLAAVLFKTAQFVILVSDTETQASLFLGDIKQELIDNEDLISLFGIKGFNKLSETDIIVEMNDGHKFRIIAKGAEQKLRGLKWNNKRPDLILCDDLENDEVVQNQERREKFRRWFYGALLPVKSERGKIIIVGTILHMDSLLERLMPVLSAPTTINDELRQTSTKKGLWNAVKYRAHNEDFSKILWEDRFSKQRLQEIKEGYLFQGMPDLYSQEYLNYPIDESTSYFRRDDFIPFKQEDYEGNVTHYTGADFAISTREKADYTVIATIGVTQTGDILVTDIRRGRWDSQEIIEEMFSVQRRYKPELFITESGAIEKAIGPFLKKQMVERGVYMNLYPMVPTKDKLSRARSLQARMRAGGIRFNMDASWYPILEDEMARFPKDRHDDQVDALSWIGLVLDKLVEAPSQYEIEEDEYNEMVSEGGFSGRNTLTGY